MTTGKKVTFLIGIVVLIFVGLYVALRIHGTEDFTLKGMTEKISSGNTDSVVVLPLVEEHSTTTYAVMNLSYPKSSPTEYKEIYEFVTKARDGFPFGEDGTTLTDAEMKEMQDSIARRGEQYDFILTTRVATSSRTVSYILELYTDTGGAHGGTGIYTFTYDTHGKLVTLDRVFAKPYLEKVSTLARTYLRNKLGDNTNQEMLESGTDPTVDNYGTWYLTHDGITFVFGQYQVGPYVIGIQEFPLLKSEVSDLLAPEFK
jgi:hypothetical protein